MSNTVQNKILSYEVVPPPGVWENIAAELDESELSQSFPSKLKSYETTPPEVCWQAIAASLSAAELTGNYVERLSKAEVTPPVKVWNKIKISLEAEHEAAVPERRRFSPLLKYAVAAVVIGLMAIGAIQLLNNDNKNNLSLAKGNDPINQPAGIQNNSGNNAIADVTTRSIEDTSINQPDQLTALAEEKRNDAALEASKKTFAMLDIPNNRRLKKIAAGYHFASASETNDFSNEADNNADHARYITVMTPDCNLVRISKKLEHLSCCVSGEVVDKSCQMQLDKWRRQIACSPAGHPASFMDLLDLVDALGDE